MHCERRGGLGTGAALADVEVVRDELASHVWVGDTHILQLRADVIDGGLWGQVSALKRAEGVTRGG